MAKTTLSKLHVVIISWILPLTLLVLGCQLQGRQRSTQAPALPKIKKMVVTGFHPVMSATDKPDLVRNPLSGAVFRAEPVPREVVNKMTTNLFESLVLRRSYDLISPAQARGVYLSLVSSDLVMEEIEILKRIGRSFSADVVLTGYLYRWRERQGTDFAVDSPASVAFELYLIGPDDGAILWRGRFDKTQQSLGKNVLDMGTFLKGKGRWMTAEKLAEFGLNDLLARLPGAIEGNRE